MRVVSDDALATLTIYQEARGEPYEGKVAVGEVIRNRMRKLNKGVAGVVLAPYQFSGFNTSDKNRIPSFMADDVDPVVLDCKRAWLDSEFSSLTDGATHYVNLDLASPPWAVELTELAVIGHHTFFS